MSAQFQDQLAELRRSFLADSLRRCGSLRGQMRLLREDGAREIAVCEIRKTVHSLAGAGGIFGFPEISRAAARIEDVIEAGDWTADAGVSGLQAQCETLLALIEAALSRESADAELSLESAALA